MILNLKEKRAFTAGVLALLTAFAVYTIDEEVDVLCDSDVGNIIDRRGLSANIAEGGHGSLRDPVQRRATGYSYIPGHECFHNMRGMTEAMFDLEKKYPDLVAVQSIGKSSLENDIHAMKITSTETITSSKGVMLLTSGVHSREYAPPELLMQFAQAIVDEYNKDADTTWILQQTEIHIIFYMNPDGRHKAEDEHQTMWRKNAFLDENNSCSKYDYGVDINRNFDFLWGDLNGASDDPCSEDYMGPSSGSEPETQALMNYAKSLFPENQRKEDPVAQMDQPFGEDITGLFIDIHAYGNEVYYPWGHENIEAPDSKSLEALGRKFTSFNGYKLWAGGQPNFPYPVSGDASDYMYAVLGVASFGFEIGEAFNEDCIVFDRELQLNLPALMYAAKVSKRPFYLPKGPDIIDLDANIDDDKVMVTASASNIKLVNVNGYPESQTGGQAVTGISLYLDVHPDEVKGGFGKVDMTSNGDGYHATISTEGVSSGRHILYAQAQGDGYLGPISSMFIVVDGTSLA